MYEGDLAGVQAVDGVRGVRGGQEAHDGGAPEAPG